MQTVQMVELEHSEHPVEQALQLEALGTEKVPVAQGWQPLFSPSENWLALHAVQVFDEKPYPGSQLRQNVPLLQVVHPSGQLVHWDAPVSEKVPFAQASHVALPPAENYPAAHSVQVLLARPKPESQVVQLAASVQAEQPVGQAVQAAAPAAEKDPEAQFAHESIPPAENSLAAH